ncbi:MAG: DUF2802 domain-containing protein [Sulfuricella sp.]|nr:DUF2802 domain-containing protein [Sulfuricella sp.]
MESFVITWRELLIGAVLVLAVYIAEMLLLMRSAKPRGWRVWQKGAEAHVRSRELQALELELSQLHQQVDLLQAEVDQLKAQQVTVTPYTQAIQMAQQGIDVDEVAARCGISRGEAELIVAMHRIPSP